MDSSEQHRKWKRLLRPPSSPSYSRLLHFFSVRSSLLCFSFLLFLYLLSFKVPINSSAFRPVLVVSSFSLMSSSSSSRIESIRDFGRFLFPVKIEARVLFPDHVLLLVRKNGLLVTSTKLECAYYSNSNDNKEEIGYVKQNVLFIDDYDESRVIVRCPVPPRNYSDFVNLQNVGRKDFRVWRSNNQSVASCESLRKIEET